jgi:tetratricopeptide (TPR) repeat protein
LGERKFRFHSSHPQLGDVLISLGRTYTALGRYDDAEPLLKRALSIRETKFGDNSEDAGHCHGNLASLYSQQKRVDEAEMHYEKSISISEERKGAEHADTIWYMKQLAKLYRDHDRNEKADKLDRKIREAAKDPKYTSSPTKPPQAAQTSRQWESEMNALSDEAVELNKSGKPALAIEKARKALALAEKNASPTYNLVPAGQYLLARMLWQNGQKEEAEDLMKAAIHTLEQRIGANSPTVATILRGLAELYASQSRYSEAEPLLLRVATIREMNFQQDPSAAITSLNALSDNYLLQGGHKRESESVLRRILELQEKRLGPEHVEVAQACNNLAYNLYLQRGYSQAESLYKRSQMILGKDVQANKVSLLDALSGLRKLYLATGRKSDVAQIDQYERTLAAQK